ncbi:MAG: UDP-N-acetylmuramoyl-tripeptide--D-alanyl-D-alanine ligase, partial [Chloroflexota bacterium]
GALDAGFEPGRIHTASDAEAALDVLRPRLRDGDVVLVKASRGIGLDRLVDALRVEIGEAAR